MLSQLKMVNFTLSDKCEMSRIPEQSTRGVKQGILPRVLASTTFEQPCTHKEDLIVPRHLTSETPEQFIKVSEWK
jgi:hypothetical protein